MSDLVTIHGTPPKEIKYVYSNYQTPEPELEKTGLKIDNYPYITRYVLITKGEHVDYNYNLYLRSVTAASKNYMGGIFNHYLEIEEFIGVLYDDVLLNIDGNIIKEFSKNTVLTKNLFKLKNGSYAISYFVAKPSFSFELCRNYLIKEMKRVVIELEEIKKKITTDIENEQNKWREVFNR